MNDGIPEPELDHVLGLTRLALCYQRPAPHFIYEMETLLKVGKVRLVPLNYRKSLIFNLKL